LRLFAANPGDCREKTQKDAKNGIRFLAAEVSFFYTNSTANIRRDSKSGTQQVGVIDA
jgi:hypothetical protein